MTTKPKTRFTYPKTYRNIARDKVRGGSRGAPGSVATPRKKHAKKTTDYGIQLRDKQKIKINYGLREKQFRFFVEKASSIKGDSSAKLYALLESRLDSAVFRAGFTDKRPVARQMVSHGHIMVNGRKVDIPSYAVRIGDKVSIRQQSLDKGLFKDIDIFLKKHNVDDEGVRGTLDIILEFYSR